MAGRTPHASTTSISAGTNHSRADADARTDLGQRPTRLGPEVPIWAKQVDLHLLAARPGVPELLRIERARGRAGHVEELDTEMPAEDHRQDMAGHGLLAVHGGGERGHQQLAARGGVVAGEQVR